MTHYQTKERAEADVKDFIEGEEGGTPLARRDYKVVQMGGTNAEGNPITFYAIKIYDQRGTEVAYW